MIVMLECPVTSVNAAMFVGVVLFASIAISFATPVPERIVGGVNAFIEDHPYQVALYRDRWYTCGGSIISENWIVSAAHCLRRGTVADYLIRVGSTLNTSGGVIRTITQIIIHERYSIPAAYSNDIGLLRMAQPLTFSAAIQPIPLAEEHEDVLEGTLGLISGWGSTTWYGTYPSHLQKAQVPKISRSDCQRAYATVSDVTEDMLCAGYLETGGIDACQGDSGGPLVINNKLFGIVSWGVGCGYRGNPGVYAKVPVFRSWIREKTGV